MKPVEHRVSVPAVYRRLGLAFGLVLATAAAGCANHDDGPAPRQNAPADRNIATPTGVVGQGGLPPSPSLPQKSK